jgi:hypothetical protein
VGIFDRQRATVKRLLTHYGQSVTWQRIVPGALPDPSKPWIAGAPTMIAESVRIAFFSESAGIPQEMKSLLHYAKDSEIFTGKNYGLMPVYDFVPSMNDVVIRDGLELRIQAMDPLRINGETIMHAIRFVQ